MNHTHYDVIVVGARAAGASTAMLLARAGLQVLAVEREPAGTDSLATHALTGGGVMHLVRWGLLDQVIAAGTPPVTTSTYAYGGDRCEVPIEPNQGGNALYAPRSSVLDPLLAEAAAREGAEVRFGVRVTGLVRDRGRVVGVRLAGTGAPSQVYARLVVGADGARSIVARKAKAKVTHRARRHTAVACGYWPGLRTAGYEWGFTPDACTVVIPTNGGLVCLVSSVRPQRIGHGGPEVIRSIISDSDPDLAVRLDRAGDPVLTRAWRETPSHMRSAHGPGWALVGDAGCSLDPVVANGRTDALCDAELLARQVAVGFDGADSALSAALAEYEVVRDRLSIPLLELTERLAAQERDHDELQVLVRRMSSATSAEVKHLATLDHLVRGGAL